MPISEFYAQSLFELELEFVNQLNIYRKKHGLGPVNYDAKIAHLANYHAKYLAECSVLNHDVHYDKSPHDEQYDIKNHKELNFKQRAEMEPNKNIWAEIQIQSHHNKNKETNSNVAKSIIESFDKSPGHKEIMLCEDLNPKFKNIIGVSIVKYQINSGSSFNTYSVNIDFGVLIP